MKRLFVAFLVLPIIAAAQTEEGAKEVTPTAMVKALPNGGSTRYNILTQERNEIQNELTEAINANPKAPDRAASLKNIGRLQANLKSINLEIEKAAKEAPTDARWTGATAASRKSTPQKPEAPLASATSQTYEPWDIFKNFGQ